MVAEGAPAPDFELTADDGTRVRLSDYGGRPVVLYFYPRDDTPGCTKQACGFRDLYGEIEAKGRHPRRQPDTERAHVDFKQKYGLPFTLLADPEHEAAKAYGVWVEKEMYGKTSMGIKRSTFVIAADGTVKSAMVGVKPEENPGQVLTLL